MAKSLCYYSGVRGSFIFKNLRHTLHKRGRATNKKSFTAVGAVSGLIDYLGRYSSCFYSLMWNFVGWRFAYDKYYVKVWVRIF